MRLIDADAAKAELLRIVGEIHAWGEFFDGVRSGYQSAADRLDTMPVVEKRKYGLWLIKPLAGRSTVRCSCCRTVFRENSGKWTYCPYCGAKMDGDNDG